MKNIEEIFRTNLKKYLKEQRKSQKELAEYLEVTPAIVSYYIKGTNTPRMDKIDKISKFFGIERSDLIGHNTDLLELEKNNLTLSQGIKIPVLGSVPAGIPITAVEDILDYEEIPQSWANQGEFFALKIKGDSMEPRMISGDVAIVKQQSDADSGDVVIALVNGNEATCKKLEKTNNGIMLISTNTKYAPMFFSNEQISELPVVILGKVVELRQKY